MKIHKNCKNKNVYTSNKYVELLNNTSSKTIFFSDQKIQQSKIAYC